MLSEESCESYGNSSVDGKLGPVSGSVRGRVLGLLGDGSPRLVSEIARLLGLPAGSVRWACYDLFKLSLLLKSELAGGVLVLDRNGPRKPCGDYSFLDAPKGVNEVQVGKVRYLRRVARRDPKFWSSHNLREEGYMTGQERVMRLLLDHTPRSTRRVGQELGLSEERAYNALHELYEKGAVLRTEKVHVSKAERKWRRQARYHLWIAADESGKKRCFLNGERYVGYGKREGRSLAETILNHVKTNLRDHAIFTTDLKEKVEQESGEPVQQSMIMGSIRARRDPEVYVSGHEGPLRVTPFEQGYAVTWINPNLPRNEAIKQAEEKISKLVRTDERSSPHFRRVHEAYDLVTSISMRRDIASSILVMSVLNCTRHELEVTLLRLLEYYPSVKKIAVFGDEHGDYGYPHFYNSDVIGQVDVEAAVRAKERFIMKIKKSDERKGHALEGVSWWALQKTQHVKFERQQHRFEGMHPNRHTLHLTQPVRGRKRNAEIDGYWRSRSGQGELHQLSSNEWIDNVLEVKFDLIGRNVLEEFRDVLKSSSEFGVDTQDGREIKNGVVLWMIGAAIDNKAHIRIGNEYLNIAVYAGRLGIKFIPISQINQLLRNHGWTKASVQAICRIAKDANEAMIIMDEVWKYPKSAEKVLDRYREQNKFILEQERLLEERMAHSRKSKTILDESEKLEERKTEKVDGAAF